MVGVGYSLGACYLLGTYHYLFECDHELRHRIKALLTVSPQNGMGPMWFPKFKPLKNYRRGYLRSFYPEWFGLEAGAWPPLVSRVDTHDPMMYQGKVFPKSIWTIHDWTHENLQRASQIHVPYHMSSSKRDSIVSTDR